MTTCLGNSCLFDYTVRVFRGPFFKFCVCPSFPFCIECEVWNVIVDSS